ncbi:unnamed protein product [Chrysoparadoxa australica]
MQDDPDERAVLMSLFEATNGQHWRNNDGWGTERPLSEWDGVIVDEEDVVELNVCSKYIKGEIPQGLGQLSNLHRLDLSGNELSGPITVELGQLSSLQVLDLSSNELSGPIPKELGELSSLKELYLYNNQFSGAMPVELGKLSSLQMLYLNRNQLSGGIPVELGQLSSLQGLQLSVNRLYGAIPRELGQLSSLQILYLSENQLDGAIPAELGQLSSLKELYLYNNQLSGAMPVELGQLNRLKRLDLSDNELSGVIPKDLRKLSSLQELYLSHNDLSVFPQPLAGKLASRSGALKLRLHDNPWQKPPALVVNQNSLEAISSWYRDVGGAGGLESSKLKVVLVGEAYAGKTSILQRMKDKDAPLPEHSADDRTVGIERHKSLDLTTSGAVEAKFWDFAGQREYFSYHQLFLTPGALYLLVVDLNSFLKPDFRRSRAVFRWLDALDARVPGSGVLVVGTKKDLVGDKAERALEELQQCVQGHLDSMEKRKGLWQQEQQRGQQEQQQTSTKMLTVCPDYVSVSANSPESLELLRATIEEFVTGKLAPEHRTLFPSVGITLPLSWVQGLAMLEAVRDGRDAHEAVSDVAQGSAQADLPNKKNFKPWSDLVTDWTKIARDNAQISAVLRKQETWFGYIRNKAPWLAPCDGQGFPAEFVGQAADVLQMAADIAVQQGTMLFTNNKKLLHLQPDWLINLVKPISHHQLLEDESDLWKKLTGGTHHWDMFKKSLEPPHSNEIRRFGSRLKYHCERLQHEGLICKLMLRFLWFVVFEGQVVGSGYNETARMMTEALVENGFLFEYGAAGDGASDGPWYVVPTLLPDGTRDTMNFFPFVDSVDLVAQCDHVSFKEFPGWPYAPPGLLGKIVAACDGYISGIKSVWRGGVRLQLCEGPEAVITFEEFEEGEGAHDWEINLYVIGLAYSPTAEWLKKLERRVNATVHYQFPGILYQISLQETVRSSFEAGMRKAMDKLVDSAAFAHNVLLDVATKDLPYPAAVVLLPAGEGKSGTGTEIPPLGRLTKICRRLVARFKSWFRNSKEGKEEVMDPRVQGTICAPEIPPQGKLKRFHRLLAASVKSWTGNAKDGVLHLFQNEMRLHFLCAYDFSLSESEGLVVKQPRTWVRKCAPLLEAALIAVQVGVEMAGGVKIPGLDSVLNAILLEGDLRWQSKLKELAEKDKLAGDASLKDLLGYFGNERWDQCLEKLKESDYSVRQAVSSALTDIAEEEHSAAMNQCESFLNGCQDEVVAEKELLGKAYRDLCKMLKDNFDDKEELTKRLEEEGWQKLQDEKGKFHWVTSANVGKWKDKYK